MKQAAIDEDFLKAMEIKKELSQINLVSLSAL
jgi:hypothetical protein